MGLAERLESIIEPLLAREGYELVDLEFTRDGNRRFLKLFVDKPGGFSLADCEHVSHTVGAYLDNADLIEESYRLEVSSPGLDRVVKKEQDFRRFAGRKINIVTTEPVEGRRKFSGVLRGVEDGDVLVESEEIVYRMPLQEISKARLTVDVNINSIGRS